MTQPIEAHEQQGEQVVQTTNSSEQSSNSLDARGIRQSGGRVVWGNMNSIDAIKVAMKVAHTRITTWEKNIFEVPRGKCGQDFIAEVDRLIQHFNTGSRLETVALNLVVVFFPLMLQKPSKRSKSSDHKRYLSKRLLWWKEGKMMELLAEAEEIQKRLKVGKKGDSESTMRGFTRLMAEGKVKQALKLVDTGNEITGVHRLSPGVRHELRLKHPVGAELLPEVTVETGA